MKRFSFPSGAPGETLAAYEAAPFGKIRAMVQISHGMCEYFLRYQGFAEFLASRGILVFGHDHLGHGNTAKTPEELGFTVTGGGAEHLINDVHALSLHYKEKYPDIPLILFGHSMGSFIARAVTERYPEPYRAVVFCGTGGPDTPAGAGKLLAKLLMLFCGEHHRSKFVKSIAFAGYNKKFPKGCDPNAWLTRDEKTVERYNRDPFCTYTFTLRAYHDLFTLVQTVSRKDWAEHIKKDLPVLLISGEDDPVGSNGRGVRMVEERLQAAGLEHLTCKLYPEMRHEILNEIGYESVWEDILQWLEQQLH